MNKKNLEILGLEEGATREQIDSAYDALKAKYSEERFMDGEVGNNAARMLTKIETAYNELIKELEEEPATTPGDTTKSLSKVEELLKNGKVDEAQRMLDTFNERSAHWHYLQSVIFYKKNWLNESKKQLEIAVMMDGDNEKYKSAYNRLNDNINARNSANSDTYNGSDGTYRGQNMNTNYEGDQMGDSFCDDCIRCCALNMCINCMCNSCCR